MTILSNYVRTPAPIMQDILPNHPLKNIMVRTNEPHGSDTLLGYFDWDGKELILLAGANCNLSEVVLKYEIPECGPTGMICWIHSNWIELNTQEENDGSCTEEDTGT